MSARIATGGAGKAGKLSLRKTSTLILATAVGAGAMHALTPEVVQYDHAYVSQMRSMAWTNAASISSKTNASINTQLVEDSPIYENVPMGVHDSNTGALAYLRMNVTWDEGTQRWWILGWANEP